MHGYYSYCSICICHVRTPSRLRRINPTPVGKVTTTFQATSHFTSNPVFTAGPSTGPVASLQEERRLLVEERSRQGSKFGKKHSKNVKLTEIISSTVPIAEDSINNNPETVSNGKDSVVNTEENSNDDSDIPSLSAVTDKIQLDSIAQCYSSLLKGSLLVFTVNTLYCYYGRIACPQHHFRIVFYTTTVDS